MLASTKPCTINQVSKLSSYASSYALLLECSNLIGQLGTARILQHNGINTGICVIMLRLAPIRFQKVQNQL